MVIDIKKITSAVNKINDLASSDNVATPGFMFKLDRNEDDTELNGLLSVCYSDGHKSLIEYIAVKLEDTDLVGANIVVEFSPLIKAIQNCQPTGIIKCNEIKFNYLDGNILRISAAQEMEIYDADGNVESTRTLGNKQMDLKWVEPTSSVKSSILSRMKYDSIFEPEAIVDTYDKKELIDIFSRTATEKGKRIYLSSKTQSAFVANQAHLTIVPISNTGDYEEELASAREELSARGEYSEERLKQLAMERVNRVHHSIVIKQETAKALISILGKCESETVSLHRSDNKYCNIIVDEAEGEKVGVWFEMLSPNKAHVCAVERYNELGFKTYQLLFIREFLANNIKSACDNGKDGRTTFHFEPTKIEGAASNVDLVIDGVGSNDTYRVNIDAVTDTVGNLLDQKFVVNLKLFNDMLAQLKTPYVALDFDINDVDASSRSIRLAEVDSEKLSAEYGKLREETRKLCEQQGTTFDPNTTPTPVELKVKSRANCLITKQYTMLAK